MENSELRIGNYFIYDDRVNEVNGIVNKNGGYRIEFKNEAKCKLIENCNPIPLTEEWLKKFGFKKDEDNDFYLDAGCFDFCYQNKKWYLRQDGELFDLIDFDYVHQLQNLYFALTNKELTIKE